MPADIGRGRIRGQGMVVRDKIKAIVFRLELKVLAHSAEIVADMKPAGRLYPGKYSQNQAPCLKNATISLKYAPK
jgi:hypothetical protein